MRWCRGRRGQSMVEYVILFVAVAAAVATMYTFMRAAMMHRMKVGADGIGHGLLYP